MKKKYIVGIVLTVMLFCASFPGYAESIEEMKARIREQVKNDVSFNRVTTKPAPKPAAQKNDTYRSNRISAEDTHSEKEPAKTNPIVLITVFSVLLGVGNLDPDTLRRSLYILMVFAIIPAIIAKQKGRSFIAWWLLSVLFFIFVLPITLFMKKNPAKKHKLIGKAAKEREKTDPVKEEKSVEEDKPREPENAQETQTEDPETSAVDIYKKIENLSALKDKGAITEEEFRDKKNELLGRI